MLVRIKSGSYLIEWNNNQISDIITAWRARCDARILDNNIMRLNGCDWEIGPIFNILLRQYYTTMTSESDDSDSEDNVVRASATGVGTGSGSATATLAFSADNIRERLEDNEYALALVLTATRLESILTRGLQGRLDTDKEQFENLWGNVSLGRYMSMCLELGVFKDDLDQESIQPVITLRNNLAHEYGYLDDIEEDESLQEEVKDAIEDTIFFIESAEI